MYCKIKTMTDDRLFEYLDMKFLRYDKSRTLWTIHSWEYAGCDYGFELFIKRVERLYKQDETEPYKTVNTWCLKTLEDSGYSTGRELVVFNGDELVWQWAQFFAPTNREFKTERK
jgi:hypothetical protein